MNGDLQTIFDKITDISQKLVIIETKQEERHFENRDDIRVLFKKHNEVDNFIRKLPCSVHKEKFKVYDDHIAQGKAWRLAIICVVIGVVVQGLLIAKNFGEFKGRVSEHIRGKIHEDTKKR